MTLRSEAKNIGSNGRQRSSADRQSNYNTNNNNNNIQISIAEECHSFRGTEVFTDSPDRQLTCFALGQKRRDLKVLVSLLTQHSTFN